MDMQKKIQVPTWTLISAGITTVILMYGLTGLAANTAPPEPEVITKTRTVTKEIEVKDDSQTKEIEALEVQLEACKTSTLSSSQAFVDVTNAFVTMAQGASEFDVSKVEEATAMIEAIDSETVGTQARACDVDIASKISGIPE